VAIPSVSIVSGNSLSTFNIDSCLFCSLLVIKRCYFTITKIMHLCLKPIFKILKINFTGI
jgi:hypothetical protein